MTNKKIFKKNAGKHVYICIKDEIFRTPKTTVESTRIKVRSPKENKIIFTFATGQQTFSYFVFLQYCQFKMQERFYYM